MLTTFRQRFLLLLGSAQARAMKDVALHARSNAEYQRLRKGPWRRWTQSPNNPLGYTVQIVCSVIVLLAALWWWVHAQPDLRGIASSADSNDSNPLWQLLTAQITVAALTYPIVLGLVSVFVTRGRSSARLDAYLHHSAAEFSGLSAFFLAALLGVHLALQPHVPPAVDRMAIWIYLAWLIANLISIALFLNRTVCFLRPKYREGVYLDYALFKIWPRQLTEAMAIEHASAICSQPIRCGDGTELRIDVTPFLADEGTAVLQKNGRYPARLVDLWANLVSSGITAWIRQFPSASDTRVVLPCRLTAQYSLPTSILRVVRKTAEGSLPVLNLFERFLVQFGFRWRSTIREATNQSVVELFADLLREAHSAMADRQIDEFQDAVQAAVRFHAHFLKANEVTSPKPDNLAHMSFGWSMQSINDEFYGVYRDLIEKAVEMLDINEEYFHEAAYLAPRLLREYAPLQEKRVIRSGNELWTTVGYLLGDWWERRIQARGLEQGAADTGRVLDSRLRAAHDRALRYHLGAHGSVLESIGRLRAGAAPWEDVAERFERLVFDLHQLARLFLRQVRFGDDLGSAAYSDILQRWLSEAHGFRSHDSWYVDADRVPSLHVLSLPWEEVQYALESPQVDGRGATPEALEAKLVGRYWGDLIATVIAILVHRAPTASENDSLSLVRARDLLFFKESFADGGSRVGVEPPVRTLPDFFESWIRIQITEHSGSNSTGNWLDSLLRVVEDSHGRNWISHRVYSGDTLSLYGLLAAQLLVMVALATSSRHAMPGGTAETLLLEGVRNPSIGDHAEHRLKQALEELERLDMAKATRVATALSEKEHTQEEVNAGRALIRSKLADLLSSLQSARSARVRSAPLSNVRPQQYRQAANAAAEKAQKDSIIFRIAGAVNYDPALERVLSIRSQILRAEVTDPPLTTLLDEDLSGLRGWIERYIVARTSGQFLGAIKPEIAQVRNAEEFDAALNRAVSTLLGQQKLPRVLLSSNAHPPYIREWAAGRRVIGERRLEKPRTGGARGHHGMWGDVPVDAIRLDAHSTLVLPADAVRSVVLSGEGLDSIFDVRLENTEALTVDLLLLWGLRVDVLESVSFQIDIVDEAI